MGSVCLFVAPEILTVIDPGSQCRQLKFIQPTASSPSAIIESGPSGYRDSSFARVNYERKENVPAVYLYHIYVHEQNTRISRIIPECIVGGHSGGGEGGGEEIRF